ncbi:uncharacterized protein LOC131039601 isoform X2 [Cryptomeria japonica]|uniref:uncharacterized protein LOC131039601 isoform X2 n=1 Tax=Cryptomeria japonica TaxID=3369 RepID=UPI0027DA2E86|nr:uncharacterized protein LOC131039601 isoform X2 [Cryptomeria japonica]
MEAEEGKEDEVMSEIHLGCPPDAKSHFTRFTILPSVLPSTNPLTGDFQENTNSNCLSNEGEASSCQRLLVDKEGDLVLARRKQNPHNVRHAHDSILIHHHIITVIPSVGLQIWRASLILADFIIHFIHTSSYFNNVVALELGAGTGLVGILLARAASTVFITDKGNAILDNCLHNVELNMHTFKHNEKSVRVRQLDWQDSWPPKEVQTEESLTIYKYKYSWTSSDIKEAEKVSVLLAADVVYSDELTEAFFKVLQELMPLGSKKVLFLSLEKRYNFTMEDLDIVAHGHQYFRTFIAEEVPESKITGGSARVAVTRAPSCDTGVAGPIDAGRDRLYCSYWPLRGDAHARDSDESRPDYSLGRVMAQ